jgi:hypothetical protein
MTSFQQIFKGFTTINDFFTSTIVFLGFWFALFIYLSNKKIISSKNSMSIIQKMPDFLPFKHALEHYFSQFIKKDFKIIVLIRTLDEKNYEWVLNQIAAYNKIMNSHILIESEPDIEFLFVKKHTDDIKTLISELNIHQYHYIIISSLSAIFKDAILAREKLSEEEKNHIQIIGALSSINDTEVQQIIDYDDKIIRIFPPDYDEAKTAMEFLFSKVKNSICSNSKCNYHNQKNNIIVIHNGTYGRAVRDKCNFYFDEELQNLNLNTSTNTSAKELNESINFYSFDYKNNGEFIYDQIESKSFEPFLEKWSDAENYFYIVGYEPNISNILEQFDTLLDPYSGFKFSLIFSGTASMDTWRESIVNTIKKSKNLNISLSDQTYYLKLHTINQVIGSIKPVNSLNLKLKHYEVEEDNKVADIYTEMTELFKESKHFTEVNNILESSWKNKNNYITTFTTDSMHIALYAIENESSSLLESKFKVLKEKGRSTDILVNGDSINQYTVKFLN